MNLIIDIGNTRIKCAVFEGEKLVEHFSYPGMDQSMFNEIFENFPPINKAIITATRAYDSWIDELLESRVDQFVKFNPDTPVPITNNYESPRTLGLDRLAAAVGAATMYPNKNILIIDAGTAITYEFVDAELGYLGGNIAPGLQMRLKALNHYTGKLPLVEVSEDFKKIGKTTQGAILAGVVNGMIYEMDGTIDHFRSKCRDIRVILTGGDSIFFDKKLKNSIFVNLNLTLIGLNGILEYNVTC
ncbi:type III pantothenate kinase [Puteibacter caeruleilacunae]|nr:type III pantothenate kinase [Puteibacter caeruleilacunae]